MRKICFIMPHVTGKGGTENVMRIVMQSLQQQNGLSPKLYLFGGSEDKVWLKDINYSEDVFSNNKMIRNIQNLLLIFLCIFRFIKKERPEMVICTHSITCFVVYWIRLFTRGNYSIISWIHFSLNAKNVKSNFLQYADFHLAICEGIKRQFKELGFQEQNVFLINNPVLRTDYIIPRPQKNISFIYVGRIEFEAQKRVKDLLDAFSEIQGEWKLQIIGDGLDQDICIDYAVKKGLSDKITWSGWQKNPWVTVKCATALILTSAYEGFGMVLSEAIARGVYCISSDCEVGPSDIIQDKINGELYEPGDVESLRTTLQNIIKGKSLPEQIKIKKSIEKYYLENYMKTFVSSLDRIHSDWKNKKK